MKNKKYKFGMLIIILTSGMFISGCLREMPRTYINLGNVSEDNCALVEVSNVKIIESRFTISTSADIDGQRDDQWIGSYSKISGFGKVIVRVTPGNHTFKIGFAYDIISDGAWRYIPVTIEYDCKAGKGYTLSISDRVLTDDPLNPISAEIIVNESDIAENGNFGGRNSKAVAKKTEIFYPKYLEMLY